MIFIIHPILNFKYSNTIPFTDESLTNNLAVKTQNKKTSWEI
jgi:hypothetical protein